MKLHDETERREWQNPEAILESLGLGPGWVVADIGSGEGFFTLPAARIVGPRGAVYAVDPSVGRLTRLHETAEEEGLENIRIRAGTAEEFVVCEGCADLVFFGICLHDFADQAAALRNAMTALKPGGLLANLDWKKEGTIRHGDLLGPPVEIRFTEEEAASMIGAAGFAIESVEPYGEYFYLIRARRP
ncbi:MAG TPA: class I SAM-dependent methyltransferase [Methanoregulaceae archaeon]|nr:class I SAM-dependent methyltransferase [Methanoregulaceae archaeon]